MLFPLSNLGLSGSLGGAWLLLGIVITIEILTDRLHLNGRWLMAMIGSIVVIIIIHIVELIIPIFVITYDPTVLTLMVYAPLIWGCIVGVTNIRSSNQGNERQGEQNENNK